MIRSYEEDIALLKIAEQVAALLDSAELLIEVECPEKNTENFKEHYITETGEDPTTSEGFLKSRNHGGPEIGFYFNTTIEVVRKIIALGYKPTCSEWSDSRGSWRSEYKYRLRSNTLFWPLTHLGFRLGHRTAVKQPITKLTNEVLNEWQFTNLVSRLTDLEEQIKVSTQEEVKESTSAKTNRAIKCFVSAGEHAAKAAALKRSIQKMNALYEIMLETATAPSKENVAA